MSVISGISRLLFILPLLSLCIALLIPFCAHADTSGRYGITNYNINILINACGSAGIKEYITYEFDIRLNGALRDVDTSETGGVKNEKVFVEKSGTLTEFASDNSSTQGTYAIGMESSLAKFKVFEPSRNETKTFRYKYRLDDVVTKYKDSAEFNKKIIDTGWNVPLHNINVIITLPEGAAREGIKIFVYSPSPVSPKSLTEEISGSLSLHSKQDHLLR